MTFSVLIFAYRKPGTTPEQFRAHYEGKHVPLVKEISGEYVPTVSPSTARQLPHKLPPGAIVPRAESPSLNRCTNQITEYPLRTYCGLPDTSL